jgi:hypothetical protein
MSSFSEHAALGLDLMFAVAGEEVTYQPAGGASRTVLMCEEQEQDGQSPAQSGVRAHRRVKFLPTAARQGIDPDEVNIGADRLSIGGRPWQFAGRPLLRDGVVIAEIK